MSVAPPQAVIRAARSGDVAAIAALIVLGAAAGAPNREAAAIEAADPAYLAAFDRILGASDTRLFVAELHGRAIGTYQISFLPGLAARGRLRAKIESVHVDPDHRSQGIGAAMMRHAIALARKEGVGLLELSSDKRRGDAHRFYARLGFAQSHEGFKMAL